MTDFSIKQNDTRPSLEAQLLDENKEPRDLQPVTNVSFYMENVSTNEIVVNAEATVLEAADGTVVYEWQEGDVKSSGRHIAEFEITYNDGVETFPNNGYINIYVEEDIE